ncbi:MAG: hypothetical protein ACFFEV_03760 [Candidatus Thorarchaeota archaeon]
MGEYSHTLKGASCALIDIEDDYCRLVHGATFLALRTKEMVDPGKILDWIMAINFSGRGL